MSVCHCGSCTVAFVLGLWVVLGGCASPRETSTPVGARLQNRSKSPSEGAGDGAGGSDQARRASRQGSSAPDDAIAYANGHPIKRHRVFDLLLGAQGVGILEQLIVLDEAQRLAASRGLHITRSDLVREREIALRKLSDPLWPASEGPFDETAAERMLDAILAERNISQREFEIAMRRQAYLRKIVGADESFSDAELKREYELRYGTRLRVRHIQLATPREAARVQRALADGKGFAELARSYSANTATAQRGGAMPPFSVADDSLPAVFRSAADALDVGDTTDPVRVGEWYHIIRLEERIAAAEVEFESVRSELQTGVRRRTSDARMGDLYERLFREAKVEIVDPRLREAFRRVHGS